MAIARTKDPVGTSRSNALKAILEGRRRELMHDVQGGIRHVRADGTFHGQVLDEGESSEVDIQDDIELALIQMRAETLAQVNEALRRLDAGAYGQCIECGEPIGEARLRALPFAVRCKECEEVRETAEQRPRRLGYRRSSSALLFDVSS
jgi:DnaK suppressor protein